MCCSEGGIWATLWGLLLVRDAWTASAQNTGRCSAHFLADSGACSLPAELPCSLLPLQWDVLFMPVPDVFRTPFQARRLLSLRAKAEEAGLSAMLACGVRQPP